MVATNEAKVPDGPKHDSAVRLVSIGPLRSAVKESMVKHTIHVRMVKLLRHTRVRERTGPSVDVSLSRAQSKRAKGPSSTFNSIY